MKCPKCAYLGFETGDRCKNCGYDFSLMRAPAPVPDVIDAPAADTPTTQFWLDDVDERLAQPQPATVAAPPSAVESKAAHALPLFMPPGEDDDDEPLIKLPVAPRAPLSVRKTPETPRMRAVSRSSPRTDAEPVLQFADEIAPLVDLQLRDAPREPAPVPASRVQNARAHVEASSPGARLGAALIDNVILLAIDAAVVYFTLRMAVLPLSEWRVLPAIPLLAFLGLVKFAYFCAFTAVGGQTIGKMALSLRVVTDDNARVDGAGAIRRTLAGVTALVFGLGFIPALVGSERRAFHDRVAHTRVIALRSA